MNTNTLGQAIKYYRREKKLSQEDLARLSGVSYNSIIKIEKRNRRANPTIDTLKEISRVLEISIQTFLDFQPETLA